MNLMHMDGRMKKRRRNDEMKLLNISMN